MIVVVVEKNELFESMLTTFKKEGHLKKTPKSLVEEPYEDFKTFVRRLYEKEKEA